MVEDILDAFVDAALAALISERPALFDNAHPFCPLPPGQGLHAASAYNASWKGAHALMGSEKSGASPLTMQFVAMHRQFFEDSHGVSALKSTAWMESAKLSTARALTA